MFRSLTDPYPIPSLKADDRLFLEYPSSGTHPDSNSIHLWLVNNWDLNSPCIQKEQTMKPKSTKFGRSHQYLSP